MGFRGELNKDYKIEVYKNRSVYEANLMGKTGLVERIPVTFRKGNNNIDYISTSRLESYESCPSCFKQTFLDRTLDTSSYFTYFGTAYHAVNEEIINHYIETGEQIEPQCQKWWEKSPIHSHEKYLEFKQLLEDFWKRTRLDELPYYPIFAEKEFYMKWDGCKVPVNGIIDVICKSRKDEGVYYVLDWKSNFLPFTQEELTNSLQFRIYTMAVKEMFEDCKEVRCVYHMLRHEPQHCPIFTDRQLQDTKEYVVATVNQIVADTEFPECTNTYCEHRECRHTCEAYKKMMRLQDELGFDNDFDERDHWYALEKNAHNRRYEIDKKLKERITAEGELTHDGKVYAINPIKKMGVRYADLEKVLLANNRLDLTNGFVTIKDADALYKLIKALPKKDVMLQLQALQCFYDAFSTSSVSVKKIPKK